MIARRPPPETARWFGPVESGGGHRTDEDPTRCNPTHQDRAVDDAGRAIIEVIFLAVLLLIPVVYILISVLRLQAATFAVSQAARDAGRVIDAAPSVDEAIARAQQIARIDLADQHIPDSGLTLRFVAAGNDCKNGTSIPPTLDAGATYDICIIAVVSLPGVPTAVTGAHNTVTGVYTVHIGDLREGS